MCFSPQRRTIFQHLNFQKWSRIVSFLTFSLPNVLFATAACNFWCHLSAPTSAPAALTGLLLDWPDTRIYEKTQHFVTSLTFGAVPLEHFCAEPSSNNLQGSNLPRARNSSTRSSTIVCGCQENWAQSWTRIHLRGILHIPVFPRWSWNRFASSLAYCPTVVSISIGSPNVAGWSRIAKAQWCVVIWQSFGPWKMEAMD